MHILSGGNVTEELQKWLQDLRKLFVEVSNKEMERVKHFFPSERPAIPSVGDVNILESLIEDGADLDLIEQRATPCIPHVFWNQGLIEVFIAEGRDINAQDDMGDTALICAARHSLYEVVQFLLSNGANPNIANKEGETALFKLVVDVPLVRTVAPAKDMIELRHQAETTAMMLLDAGADVAVKNAQGVTILHSKPVFERYSSLIDRFENIDVRGTKYSYEQTPLMVAARAGDYDRCNLLLRKGASVHVTDMQGYTPLHYAAMTKEAECFEVLLRHGADPCVKSNSGRDVYEQCCLFGNDIMLTNNADLPKMIAMNELAGAVAILGDKDYSKGQTLWKTALELRTLANLPKPHPTREQIEAFKLAREYETDQELVSLFKVNGVNLISTALLAVDRVSSSDSQGWNLLFLLGKFLHWEQNYVDKLPHIFDVLNYVSGKMKSFEKNVGLLDLISTETILRFVEHLCNIFVPGFEDEEITARWVKPAQFFANLAIGCLKRWIEVVDASVTPHFSIYYETCNLLTYLLQFNDKKGKCTVETFKLVKKIVDLDPRDNCGNTLLHKACIFFSMDKKLVETILACETNVNAMNMFGYAPLQMVSPVTANVSKNFDLIMKFVENGAHLDSKNINLHGYHVPAIQPMIMQRRRSDTFPYITLQCLSAKVLAHSQIHYNRYLPKRMVDFVNLHL